MLRKESFLMWNKVTKFIDYINTEIDVHTKYRDTREDAKDRLKLVIMHDRSQLAPGVMEKMKGEIAEVLSRYVEINEELLDLRLEHDADTMALVANVPVIAAKKSALAS